MVSSITHLLVTRQTRLNFTRYINQNQVFRHIRNFVFDMTEMPLETDENDQPFTPTGIHWQVAHATTLQNLKFIMPISSNHEQVTHHGILTENGSGGFVSGLSYLMSYLISNSLPY